MSTELSPDILDDFEDWYEDYLKYFHYRIRDAVDEQKGFLRAAWCAASIKYSNTPVVINNPTGEITLNNKFD